MYRFKKKMKRRIPRAKTAVTNIYVHLHGGSSGGIIILPLTGSSTQVTWLTIVRGNSGEVYKTLHRSRNNVTPLYTMHVAILLLKLPWLHGWAGSDISSSKPQHPVIGWSTTSLPPRFPRARPSPSLNKTILNCSTTLTRYKSVCRHLHVSENPLYVAPSIIACTLISRNRSAWRQINVKTVTPIIHILLQRALSNNSLAPKLK